MADRKIGVTYQEEPDVLEWIESLRADLTWRRGRQVSRGDVLRWLTRRVRREMDATSELRDLAATEV